jgi:hypothetical protein
MTKNFDTLLEQMLSEMMPASMYDDMGTATSKISKKIEELPGKSQHWGPLQNLAPEVREQIVKAIIQNVFPDNDENTYSIAIDNSQQLKSAIIDAVKEVAAVNPEFKATAKWAAKFLADRLSNKDLLGNVKYTTMSGEETIKKNVTQKEVKQALNKALEEAPAEEPAETSSEEEETTEKPKDSNVETVYMKAADLSSDDPDLRKAFSKLPEDVEMSYQDVLKTIKTPKPGEALALFDKLLDSGGLTETEKEVEPDEDEEVKDLDLDDEDEVETRGYESDFERAIRDIGGVRTTREFNPSWD